MRRLLMLILIAGLAACGGDEARSDEGCWTPWEQIDDYDIDTTVCLREPLSPDADPHVVCVEDDGAVWGEEADRIKATHPYECEEWDPGAWTVSSFWWERTGGPSGPSFYVEYDCHCPTEPIPL